MPIFGYAPNFYFITKRPPLRQQERSRNAHHHSELITINIIAYQLCYCILKLQ
nr:MAG TPA: hypothetical protein [Caudoviricetes sp.]